MNKRGYKVGTIKHDAHKFDIDHPGKDSWRHKQAGAATSVISSPAKAAVVKSVSKEMTLDEIAAAFLTDVDIILTEGFKKEAKPKVEVMANEDDELISPREEVILVAADHEPDLGLPTAKRDDVTAIVDAIEDKFLKGRSGIPGVQLIVDGRPVALNGIMKTMVASVTKGLISSLKGVDNPDDVEIHLTNQR